jgi:hypothetical protein
VVITGGAFAYATLMYGKVGRVSWTPCTPPPLLTGMQLCIV